MTAASNDTRDQKYAYDGLHRLLNYDQGTWSGSAITSSNTKRYWELDQLGNWPKLRNGLTASDPVLEERAHNVVNELTAFTSPAGYVNPAHDAAGNMTTMPQPAAPTSTFTLKYDAWNRMVEVRDGSNNLVQQNEFDGLGRRIVRSVYASGSLDHRIHYYYNEEWQLLEERKEVSGTEDPDPLNQYVWHPYYVDALAVRYWDSNTDSDYLDTNEGAHYYLQDANFNVTAIVNSTGAVLERYAYSPYGEVTVLDSSFVIRASSLIANTHLYTGRERDPETGLQLNRERFYDPPLGRWITRDPIEYHGGSPNLYEYVSSSPLTFVDSMGLQYGGPGNPLPPGTPRPGFPDPNREGGNMSCKDYAFGLPTSGITEPHSEGQYRHCVAACCLKRRHSFIGDILIGAWDVIFEDQRDPGSQGDMAAERSGKCVSKTKQSCKEGCKDALKPGSPCYPKLDLYPRPCDNGEGAFPGWAGP